VAHDEPPEERVGRDDKSYSIRQRVIEDPDIPQKMMDETEATAHRRVD